MEVRAVGRFKRVSPRKARRFIDLVRGRPYNDARGILKNLASPTAEILLKILQSAGANAEHNHDADLDDCWVKSCYVDESKRSRSYRPRARGRYDRINKPRSHVTILLSDEAE